MAPGAIPIPFQKGDGIMAEKPAGSSRGGGSRPPRDAFISKLVPDPKKPDANPPRVLHGYVGDSDEDGYSRIYCGPGLEAYADVRDEDILHYEASTDGCEHTLWARADAQVKYGRRGAAKSEASGFIDGPLVQDNCCGTAAAAPAAAGAQPIGPTGWLGCTHLLGCPRTSTCPPTHTPGCDPTAATMCFICPPITSAARQCPPDPTAATMCFICPPITADCPVEAAGGAAARAAGGAAVTVATVCTQIGCPTHHPWHCPNTAATVCTQFGCPHQTAATVCTQYGCPGPVTFSPGCTLGFTCTAIGCR